ncbi:MAG: hypothetical protein PHQ47_01905 [Candidatus Portnoybacteria bacterium]|nr:hypothetical protein [Candidatus Portnoybacteria bacterium]
MSFNIHLSAEDLKEKIEKRQELIGKIRAMLERESKENLIDLNLMVARHLRAMEKGLAKQGQGENLETPGKLFNVIRSLITDFAGEKKNKEKTSVYVDLLGILSCLIKRQYPSPVEINCQTMG